MDLKDIPEIHRGTTYPSQLRKLSEENPDKHAYVFIDKDFHQTILTWKDVWDKSRKFAAILRRNGIKKGDIVCNTLVNSPERLLTALGTIVAGAISMDGKIVLADGEDIIRNCGIAKCKAIIIDPGDNKGAWPIFKRIQYTDVETGETRYKGLPDLTTVIYIKVCCDGNEDKIDRRGLQSLDEKNEMFEESDIKEDDIAIVFSTSGTTGFSKQVPHTHRSLFKFGRIFGLFVGIKSEHTRFFAHRSLGWLGGYPGPNLVFGATRVLRDIAKGMPEKLNEHIFKILNEYNIDCGIFGNGEIEFLLKRFNVGEKLQRRLHTIGLGGMPITRRLLKALGTITDTINVNYGATEVGFITYLHLTADSIFEDFCAGVPVDGAEIKVVDKNYTELPRGEIGQIAIRCKEITPGYLNEPEKTRRAMAKDGFYLTGDNGHMDQKGQIYVLGRQAFTIQREGQIFNPGWIESHILKCPGVEVTMWRAWT